jgi:hypothetical protein
MKGVVMGLLLMGMAITSRAYISGIAIQVDNSTSMQVFINGKLYNKVPKSFVRVKSQPGLFHIEVKVLDPHDRQWYVVKKDIRVEKGLEFYYRVVLNKGHRPTLEEIRRYPVYSKYYLDPSLYNRHKVT